MTSVPSISRPPRSEPALSDTGFREYCRKLTAGVAVITSRGAAGWLGTTVSTVTSVSMRPPILLFCVSLESGTLAAIRQAGRFAAHLLDEGQPALADQFSRPPAGRSRFAGLGSDVQLTGGMPVISGTLAVAWCTLHGLDEVGDHAVVYGRLSDVRVGGGSPLIWHERAYRRLEAASSRGWAP